MTGKTISPESSAGQIYNLEGVPSYDADDGEYDIEEDFVENDADTIDHHGHEREQGNGSEDSTRKPPLEVDDSERFKAIISDDIVVSPDMRQCDKDLIVNLTEEELRSNGLFKAIFITCLHTLN